jgi:hypothetical protein
MTKQTTRRAVLAGAAALPMLALPAMAGQRSDRELFALEQELEAAHARMMEASKVSSEAGERYEAIRPPQPAEPQPPAGYEELWKTITVGQLGVLPADHKIVPRRPTSHETNNPTLAMKVMRHILTSAASSPRRQRTIPPLTSTGVLSSGKKFTTRYSRSSVKFLSNRHDQLPI